MKELRFMLLVVAICLTNGVEAQFYDGPDDIYYYVEQCYEYEGTRLVMSLFNGGWKKTGTVLKEVREGENANVLIFNFDGIKAAELASAHVSSVKRTLSDSPSRYEDAVETTNYDWKYVSSKDSWTIYKPPYSSDNYKFSSDRNTLIREYFTSSDDGPVGHWITYKRVDKSFFKIGRSRTPNMTMHE